MNLLDVPEFKQLLDLKHKQAGGFYLEYLDRCSK